jgi:ABC-type transport system substrate-binding protein
MFNKRFRSPAAIILAPLVLLLLFAVACGGSTPAEPANGEKEASSDTSAKAPADTSAKDAAEAVGKLSKEVLITAVPEATAAPASAMPDWVSRGKYGGVIPIGYNTDPDKWDVHQSCCVHGPNGSASYFNNLVEFDPVKTTEMVGDLAESWKLSNDGLSYTFRLTDARWWDGKPVTADDVKFSIDRWAQKGVVRPRVNRIAAYIKDAEVINEKTLKANLLFPSPPALLPFLASAYNKIYPRHWVETLPKGVTTEPDFKPEEILGSGPFKPLAYERGNFWEAKKNQDYWKEGRPFWDGYRVSIIKGSARKIAAFRTEQVLMWASGNTGVPIRDMLNLKEELKDNWDIHTFSFGSLAGLILNVQRKPFDDVNVRRAFYLAMDRKAMVEAIAAGQGYMGTPFPPDNWWSAPKDEIWTWPGYRYVDADGKPLANPYVEGAVKDPRDFVEGKRLLAEAGYPEGIKEITVSINNESRARITAQLAQVDLRKIGIEMKIDTLERLTVLERMASGEFDVLHTGYGMNISDPDDLLKAFYTPGGSRNMVNWNDDTVTQLADEIARESDRAKRKELVIQVEDILRRGDSHFVGTQWGFRWQWPVNKKIKNFHTPVSLQVSLKKEHLWLDEAYHGQYK